MAAAAPLLPYISAFASVASAVSSFSAGDDAREQSSIEAQKERNRATAEARIRRQDAESLKKRQRGSFAASGVRVNTGTPLLLQADSLQAGEEDALNILNNSIFEVGTINATGQAARDRKRSEGFNTLLTGGVTFANSF